MNPQQDQTPGLRLPQPSFNIGQAPVAAAPMPNQGQQDVSPIVAESPVSNIDAARAAMPAMQPAVPAAISPTLAASGTTAAQPEDETALDQEWVAKARETVLRTQADPYMQSREIGKIKSQYIKVRYNKDIKTAEE